MKRLLSDIANGVKNSPLMTAQLSARLDNPFIRETVGSWLKGMKAFTFLVCDDVQKRQVERNGARIGRICYYKLVNVIDTLYLPFYLTADGVVADLQPPTSDS